MASSRLATCKKVNPSGMVTRTVLRGSAEEVGGTADPVCLEELDADVREDCLELTPVLTLGAEAVTPV